MFRKLILLIIVSLALPVKVLADEHPLPFPPAEQQILLQDATVQTDRTMFDCMKLLSFQKVLTLEELDQKKYLKLKDLAKSVAAQRDSMIEFDGYVKWMGGTLATYSKYVEAGSFAAGFAKLLPIPYAGQAGQFSKFVSHFALSLSSTSAAVKQYLSSSHQFLSGVDALGESGRGKQSEMAFLTFYGDQQLTRDMMDLKAKLTATSNLSTSALSFLVSLQQYLGSTDEYWQKTKSLIGRKDAEKAEKGALAGSIDGLKTRAEEFNQRLKNFDENVAKILPLIASLVIYDGLRQEIEGK